MISQQAIDHAVQRLIAAHPAKIIQFGSYARGEAGDDSDWDKLPARDASIEDIDFNKAERYMQKANETGRRKLELSQIVEKGVLLVVGGGKKIICTLKAMKVTITVIAWARSFFS